MKKLLQLEFIKYSKSRAFYIFILLFMVIVVLLEMLIVSLGGREIGGKKVLDLGFPAAWDNLVYIASYLNFLIGLMVIISITNEYQYRTFRQHIVDGLSKLNVWVAKYLYALLLVIFSCLFVAISVIIFGSMNATTGTNGVFDGIKIIYKYFIQLIGYVTLAMFMSILFRNTALAAIIYVLYVWFLEFLLSFAFFHKSTNMYIASYFPKALFSSIVPKPPLLTFASNMAGLNTNGPSEQMTLILSCIYILVFAGGSYFLIRARDL